MIAMNGSVNSFNLSQNAVLDYIRSLYGEKVKLQRIWRIGENSDADADLKGFGYGCPYVIEFIKEEKICRVVLETMRPSDGFGHDHFSDRAQVLIWQHSAFNKLPGHVHSIDAGCFEDTGKLVSVGRCSEYFILTEFIEGSLYSIDLDRLKATGELNSFDLSRCVALSDYLVDIHKTRCASAGLYVRRIRDLVGHGECIMGLLDSYPKEFTYVRPSYFVDFEKACVEWRWKLKERTHRLCQVHGDFHPWNLLFREGTDFTTLDRSRGEWGEPACDVAALTINYLFYSLQKYGKLDGVFDRLFKLFWENYLQKTGDLEILEVVQPFYAWRSLVVASPTWYPNLSTEVRVKLLNFAQNMLQNNTFNIMKVNSYF
ncbi:MAG: aminoglycoside phosphotransferase family protein [Candidatus Bathyarchaeota archaeon]|nr:aminoglycoside phosphotransferase family protein [Candidatus Termiticorpusculum sp.]